MRSAAAAALAIVLCVQVAAAQRSDDAEQVFQAALAARDIDALEQLGAARPISRWSDDAWSEAARLAVQANDFARARRSLQQVIAIGSDEQLVRRARAELARIEGITGTSGQWASVAAQHEQLAARLGVAGDPRPTIAALEQLVHDHPGYPRAAALMITIASAWERDGSPARAERWLRQARSVATAPTDRLRARTELVRTLTRAGQFAEAERELASFDASVAPGLVVRLRRGIEAGRFRRNLRWMFAGVLVVLAALAAIALRRAAGSWASAGRRLARPPAEAVFIGPIAGVLVVAGYTGNPLVARAVCTIAVAGVITSWVSGAILDCRPRPLSGTRVLAHAAAAVVAIGAATYLAVDSGQLISFVIETWRAGHELG